MFDGVCWVRVVGNVWRFMDITVWEAEGTKETHLLLLSVDPPTVTGTGSGNSI